jgi:hypothetical protein
MGGGARELKGRAMAGGPCRKERRGGGEGGRGPVGAHAWAWGKRECRPAGLLEEKGRERKREMGRPKEEKERGNITKKCKFKCF